MVRGAWLNCCLWAGLACASGCGSAPPRSANEAPGHTGGVSDATDPAQEWNAGLGELTDRQLERLERIVADDEGSEQARVHLVLADAYLSRASRATAVRLELDERRYDATALERAALDKQYAQITDERGDWLAKAIRSFEAVLATSDPASTELRPAARMGLSDALQRAERLEESNAVLAALVRDDPQHPFAGYALTQLGDKAFEDADFAEARILYEQAREVATTGDRLYAEYKLGWVALNVGQEVRALEAWARVVRDARLGPEHRALADAAARDCVRVFASIGLPSEARAFFRRLHPELAPALLMELAAAYRDEGRDADALVVLGAAPSQTKRDGPP